MIKKSLLLSALLLLPTLLPAADESREADHESLRGLLEQARRAVNEQNLETLLGLLAPKFAITMADQTPITSRETLEAYFRQLFTGDDALLEAIEVNPEADVPTDFTGERTGINYGNSVDTYTLVGGRQVTLPARWTASVVKIGDEWKIKTFHAGVNMIDNPILSAVQQMNYVWGGVALGVGVVLGLLLGRRKRAAP